MTSLAIANFDIPGEPRFPLNAMYGKPANQNEAGGLLQQSLVKQFARDTVGTYCIPKLMCVITDVCHHNRFVTAVFIMINIFPAFHRKVK